MKKLLLLTKTLLAVALLCVGQNAWADTETVDIFSQASWSHTHSGETGDRSSSLSFTGTSSIDDNWTASFDVTTTSTNSRTNGARNFQVALLSASAASFPSNALANTNVLLGANFVTTNNTDYSSFPCTITVNDVAEAKTVTLNHGTTYTFTVSVNKTSMTVSINNGETSVFSKEVTLGSFVKPKGIYDLLPRPYNAKWGVYTNTYSDILVTKEIDASVCAEPTSTITGASGNSRKFTLACETPASTIYYSETEKAYGDDGWTEYSSEVTTAATTIYMYAATAKAHSDVTSFATGAGTPVSLIAPSFLHSAANQYTINNDQSGIIGKPTATVHYQIDGGVEQTSTSTSLVIPISADGTLTYWLTADGYESTEKTDASVYTYVPLAVTTTINLCTSNANDWSTHGDEVAVTEDEGHTYYKYKDQAGNIVSDGKFAATFGYSTTDQSWRIQRFYGGTKNQNSAEHIAILDVKKGQVVRVMCDVAPTVNANATILERNTYPGTTYSFTASADGNVVLDIAKNTVLKYIYVEQDYVSKSISAAGWATYCSPYALDLANATGLKDAYIVTGAEGSVLSTTSVKGGTIPANTGILIEAPAGTVSIPVVASSETNVSDNKFQGVIEATEIAADAGYVLMGSPKVGFYQNENAFTVGANTAYLPANFAEVSGPARAAYFFRGDITGVANVEAAAEAKAQEGKFIENGKLVIVKNGVKYNAAGQQVK